MQEAFDYVRKNVWAQVAGLLAIVCFVFGGVNDAASLLTAPWMPTWLPGVFGSVLLYAAFQMMGFRLHKAAERVDAAVAAIPSPPPPSTVAPAKKLRPAEAATASHWKPDISFADAINYVQHRSSWRASYRAYSPNDEVLEAVRKALNSSQITAWARQHPDTAEYQIHPSVWEHGVNIRPSDSYAFNSRHAATLYKIRLSKHEVEAAWPPKKKGAA